MSRITAGSHHAQRALPDTQNGSYPTMAATRGGGLLRSVHLRVAPSGRCNGVRYSCVVPVRRYPQGSSQGGRFAPDGRPDDVLSDDDLSLPAAHPDGEDDTAAVSPEVRAAQEELDAASEDLVATAAACEHFVPKGKTIRAVKQEYAPLSQAREDAFARVDDALRNIESVSLAQDTCRRP